MNTNIPTGSTKEDIKSREKIILEFYAQWINDNPTKKVWNESLCDYIHIKYLSINETYNKAARTAESTLAVFRLTELLQKSRVIREDKLENLIIIDHSQGT